MLVAFGVVFQLPVVLMFLGYVGIVSSAMLKSNFDAAPDAVELPPGIGLSVGWIEVPPGTNDLMPLVAEADARMYVDKGAR